MSTSMTLEFADVASILRNAGREDLVEWLLRALPRESTAPHKDLLTSKQAAALLGLSSPNTVKNWLQGGFFPGAFRTPGGHWRFPRAEVEAAKRWMEALREQNARGELVLPDEDAEDPPPLL